ncbi:MAG: hypothetical protein QNJ53_31100 [Pleurocapsa sp. MO_192.B19]|nr:hypothetical protein [Pleurocapsa sp. MO_192.B19]
MYRRSYAKSSTNSKDELRTPAFESLSIEEQKLRSSLEEKVRTAFSSAGMALIEINELRLYRSTHLSFEEFCQDIFGYSSDYAYLKMGFCRKKLRNNWLRVFSLGLICLKSYIYLESH